MTSDVDTRPRSDANREKRRRGVEPFNSAEFRVHH